MDTPESWHTMCLIFGREEGDDPQISKGFLYNPYFEHFIGMSNFFFFTVR